MFVPQEALNQAHLTSAMYRNGSERKWRRLVFEETEERIGGVFLAYGTPLKAVPSFSYLVKTLSSFEDDWPEVEQNLRRAGGNWYDR